ncbi:preprotein translocase subunit SCY1, chloroplastic-like [Musa acuminata AAA Group]|uniref:preprotein translocase subunit SCY1, chloroplastic-like n=1 Tax=Musa acuminata AAA Group TaxID=214697 RepID=UPI0031CE1475
MLLSARELLSAPSHGIPFSTFPSARSPAASLAFARSRGGPCRASSSGAADAEPRRRSVPWDTLRLNFSDGSRCIQPSDFSVFDPLGLNKESSLGLGALWESVLDFFSQTFESTASSKKDKSSSKRGVAAAIEDSSIDIGDFFKGPLPGKFLKLLGYLTLSRLGVYVPLGGVNREAFVGNLDQNSLLSTLDSFSGGGIGRLGVCSLGIVPFINAQIVFQLLTQIYPKLQDLQRREGEAGRKKVLQYTRYASVGFAVFQAIGQVVYLRPYVNDFSTEWVLSSVVLLTLGSVFTTYIGERISDLKLGNGTSLLIFTSIISYLPASFGRTIAQAFQDGNYVGLATITLSFFLLVLGIVYVQEAERKIPLNYASRYRSGGLQKSAYLPFKVNSSGVMPIIFSTSSLALPGTLARFTGLTALKKAAVALNPGGPLYLPTNVLLIAFFNYYYTFLQLDPDDVSEQLKRQGASIPLVRPGKSTAAFLKTVLSRISVLGSAFLAVLAAGPSVIEQTTHLTAFRGFAGTSILILVGCATDTARKVQAEIISQKYKNIEFYDINQYGP